MRAFDPPRLALAYLPGDDLIAQLGFYLWLFQCPWPYDAECWECLANLEEVRTLAAD